MKIRLNLPKPIQTKAKRILEVAGIVILSFHFLFGGIVGLYAIYIRFLNPPVASIMIYRTAFNRITPKKQYFIPVNHVKRKYLNLLIYTEDPSFYYHNGIDIPSILSAVRVNFRSGQKLSGASTITQQLTRTLILFPEKLYARKYLEAFAAIIIDIIVPKERQLELYINYAEWGRGIYGINSASNHYYGTSLYKLDDDQVMRLITVLPSPVRYTPHTFGQRARLNQRYYKLNEIMNSFHTSH
jgi:monofunctional glycosyltransferase